MSCDQSANLISGIARRQGIAQAAAKSGFGGNSPQSLPQPAKPGPARRQKKQGTANRQSGSAKAGAQASFFALAQPAAKKSKQPPKAKSAPRSKSLPTQRQIKMTNEFSAKELQTLTVQLRLGEAAAARHIQTLNSKTSRGIGHSDPRPLDWVRSDQKNFQFLGQQLRQARRGNGYLDTSGLKDEALMDLWEFARFEADRALRNIDHLQAGLSHIKGQTADYLTGRHRLEARFYAFLAGQLEPLITPKMQEAYLDK
jgi:hypothetical protein